MIRYRIRKRRNRRSRENIRWVSGSIVLIGPVVNQELALHHADDDSEILGIDDAEMGEFAYNYIGLEAEINPKHEISARPMEEKRPGQGTIICLESIDRGFFLFLSF
jgi:hypothetical protein